MKKLNDEKHSQVQASFPSKSMEENIIILLREIQGEIAGTSTNYSKQLACLNDASAHKLQINQNRQSQRWYEFFC